MKRVLHLICLLAVAALLPSALFISRGLPADTRPYVEQKYAGWNGVLRAWICADWECAGSFTRWLNACAASFEKNHDGVYIEFTPVSAEVLQRMNDSGIRPPELILFSPGAVGNLAGLKEIAVPDALRSELRSVRSHAYPVAMGGYIWAYNPTLSSKTSFAVPSDDAAHSYSAAGIALMSDVPGEDAPEDALPDAGLDLGLPASAAQEPQEEGLIVADDALDRFIRGELPAVIASQSDLARLIRLRDSGRGPDWVLSPSGGAAYTDQLLLLGIVAQAGDAAEERESLAEAFAAGLLEFDAQSKLADIGAFSVTGERIYPDFSDYAQLDILLNSRELIVTGDPRRSPPDCSELLRSLVRGAIDPGNAIARLRGDI